MNAAKTRNKDADIFNGLVLMAAMHMKKTISGKINIKRSPIRLLSQYIIRFIPDTRNWWRIPTLTKHEIQMQLTYYINKVE